MIKKIRLKNFMSHQSSEFELVKGLNVLTGPNNSGKSAVISALQMLTDLPVKEGDYMVRHGTSDSEVTIVTEEGDELTWQRKGSTISLIINGEKHVRLQNDREHYLEKLHKFLRLPKVSGNENKDKDDFDIHFATQKNPIFLINDPPTRAALFFASSSDAGRLLEVRDRFKDLVNSKKKEQQRIKAELQKQCDILAKLAPIDAMGEQISFVLETYKQFPKEQELLRNFTSLLGDLATQRCKFNEIATKQQVLQTLLRPPLLENTQEIERHRAELVKERNSYDIRAEKNRALSAIASPPEIEPVQSLSKDLHLLRGTQQRAGDLEKTRIILGKLQPKPEIEDAESLATLLKSIKDLLLLRTKLRLYQDHLDGISTPPVLEQDSPLSKLLRDLCTIGSREGALRKRFDKLAKLNSVPNIEDLQQIENVHIALRNVKFRQSLADRIHAMLSRLHAPPIIVNTLLIEQYLPSLKKSQKQHSYLLQREQLEALFQPPPRLEDLDLLEKYLRNFHQQAAHACQLTLQKQESEDALRAWLVEYPSCPICGGDLNMEKLEGSLCYA